MKKYKFIMLILIIILIIISYAFINALINYFKTTKKTDNSIQFINTEAQLNNKIIKVDKDSSIRILEEYDENMFKGKKSLVFFWASWCSHCLEEYNVVKTAITDYQNKGYNIYLISHDYEKEELSKFMKNNDLNYEVYYDEQRIIRNHFTPQASSVPLTYIIDENAKLIDSYNGAITLDELNKLIDKNMY